jgi:hypothetical protein
MANKLHRNTKKSCFIEFSKNKTQMGELPIEHRLNINGNPLLLKVKETKFLGVILDENLSFNAHREWLVKKLATSSGILCSIKDSIPVTLHKNIYQTLFESHLTYGIFVWGGSSNNNRTLYSKFRNRCVRIMFGDKEAYLEKFKTAARIRPFGAQKPG